MNKGDVPTGPTANLAAYRVAVTTGALHQTLLWIAIAIVLAGLVVLRHNSDPLLHARATNMLALLLFPLFYISIGLREPSGRV